jgi:26S proteasome regulatory subunit N6
LGDDVIVQAHVGELNDDLLQSNLAQLVEPYSHVQIAHIALLIKLPVVCWCWRG